MPGSLALPLLMLLLKLLFLLLHPETRFVEKG